MIYAEDAKNHKTVLAIGLHGLPIAVDEDSFRDGQIVGWNVDHRYVPMLSTGLKSKTGKEYLSGRYYMEAISRRLHDCSME